MPTDEAVLSAARAGDHAAFGKLVEPYRRELRAHCYRMSGSLHDAEDLVQDSLVRAWRGISGFEGRSSVRTWLYRVATNACLDALDQKKGRALPMDLAPSPAGPGEPLGPPRLEPMWLEPCPAELYADAVPAPDARYGARESVALAFLAALQLLPARQRALLILHDVLGWPAAECAELVDLSVAAVNSALQRARETLSKQGGRARAHPTPPADDTIRSLLARYVQAWEQADVASLVSLLHEDATLSMPPLPQWLQGAQAIGASIGAMVLTPEAVGAFRLRETAANGLHALAAYRLDPSSGEHRAYALHLLTFEGDRIAAITAFLDGTLVEMFGLPAHV
jgi:RNA polymerase sigma-70 factor (ECF subfamily)